ncbi:lariat debranching enzyme, C-terminal domain-containing protein [Cokeromyces recurvatus]|uniref:lariat debranching enzyme, C-terminal domain-containing protein n=1 Tax=Cokeromyces recurvatus TaxID=90255 RepID=UPI00222019FC|nr:lariat debranching enzyme, C-terminal domain-containing protein [Cokeromyces recurvatus]KAI7908078.1 lariat debranching enzyme, C-terminal domain-containing protein [Cokeromyces recurvatus]
MKIAIEGCCHGRLDDIYGSIRLIEQRENCKIDLVLICGDFQSIRNEADLKSMAVPEKYKELGTFWKYYSGRTRAPYPTIFIGGNHEASNYLWELYHGGWVCENIYYLGNAGVINFGGLRIGGLSGIEKLHHYKKGHYERMPYNSNDVRSIYHVREYDVKKLLQIQEHLDIFLSHDWPKNVEKFGDIEHLMKIKQYFIDQILTNTLGSQANKLLLTKLKPDYWFAAHLHVHYAAIVDHEMWEKNEYPLKTQEVLKDKAHNYGLQSRSSFSEISNDLGNNPDEIEIALDEEIENDSTVINTATHDSSNNLNESKIQTNEGNVLNKKDKTNDDNQKKRKITRFLSLDKCLPRRSFLQIVDIPSEEDSSEKGYDFYYDMEWLSITRAMHPYFSSEYQQKPIPSDEELKILIEKERIYLEEKRASGALDLKIPHNFEPTAPAYNSNNKSNNEHVYLNPQTLQFCKEIDIENKINVDCIPEQMMPKTEANIDNTTTINDQPVKRAKIEAHSEIIIDEDEFL